MKPREHILLVLRITVTVSGNIGGYMHSKAMTKVAAEAEKSHSALKSLAAHLVGFEHPPRSFARRQRQEQVVRKVVEPDSLLKFVGTGADCQAPMLRRLILKGKMDTTAAHTGFHAGY